MNYKKIEYAYYLILATVVAALIYYVKQKYWVLPFRPDELSYASMSAEPVESMKLFFRFANFHLTHLFNFLPVTPLLGAALVSMVYTMGTVIFAYLIAARISGPLGGILSAIFAAMFPPLLGHATWYSADLPCLFFGLVSIWFCVEAFYSDTKRGMWFFVGAGIFLVASIFSKQTGIAFLLPIIILALYHGEIRSLLVLFLGVALGMLILAVGDFLFLNNFFYHIDPNSYVDFLLRFKGQIERDPYLEKHLGKWSETVLQRLLYGGKNYYLHYLTAFIGFALLWPFLTRKVKKYRTEWLIMLVAMPAVISISIHEYVHISFTHLGTHWRYLLTMVIPITIAFSSLLGLYISGKYNKRSTVITICIIVIVFIVTLFLTSNDVGFYKLLRENAISNASIELNIIHIFSFWVFIVALMMVLYKAVYNDDTSRFASTITTIGLVIVVSYVTFWGSQGIHRLYYSRVDFGFSRAVEYWVNLGKENVYVFDVTDNKKTKTLFEYLTLSNLVPEKIQNNLETYDYKHIVCNECALKDLSEGAYKYILTSRKAEEINNSFLPANKNLIFHSEFRHLYLYKIMENSSD